MSEITIRHYEPTDYEMLCGWWRAHGKYEKPSIMLPKCGVVCEIDGKPVSALFLHMDNSCGMCMAEHAVSAPGLSLKTALLAFKNCVDCLKKIASELGYHSMAVFTYPGISRLLKKNGFQQVSQNNVLLIAATKEEPCQ
jgi:hypothetical protein